MKAEQSPPEIAASDSAASHSTPSDSSVAARPQATKCRPASRMRKLIPLIIIVALLAGEVLELRARGAAQAAYERITRAIGPEGKMQALKREEVRQVVGRDADDFDERTGTEIFRWTGPLKPHTLYVQYLWVRGENYANDASVDADPRLGGSRPKTVVAPGAEP